MIESKPHREGEHDKQQHIALIFGVHSPFLRTGIHRIKTHFGVFPQVTLCGLGYSGRGLSTQTVLAQGHTMLLDRRDDNVECAKVQGLSLSRTHDGLTLCAYNRNRLG